MTRILVVIVLCWVVAFFSLNFVFNYPVEEEFTEMPTTKAVILRPEMAVSAVLGAFFHGPLGIVAQAYGLQQAGLLFQVR
jgi:hypothetical protein